MTISHAEPKTDPSSLHAQIAAANEALWQRRLQSARMARTLETRLRAKLTSPKTLMVAAGLGFTLETTSHNPSRSLLNLLKTATHASLLFRALS